MSKIGFPNTVKSRLEIQISSTDLFIKIPDGDYPEWIGVLDTGDIYYALLVDADNNREIVKIKETGSTLAGGIAVERGQEGTDAKPDWPRGTMIFQDITAITLFNFQQKAIFRSGAYNPIGALTSAYAGEKFYQTDLEVWWKAITPGTGTNWRLVFGKIYVVNPTYSPPAGTYTNGTPITISTVTPNATIYYTIDGSEPDDNDTQYSAPITLPNDTSTTLKSIAYGAERYQTKSGITSGSFTMQPVIAWVEKAPQLGAETWILALAVFNGKLYGSTATNGKLLEWNGTDAWVEKAPKLGAETWIYSLAVFNNKLYGSTSPNGKLYEWNGVDAWVEKAPKLGDEDQILSMAIFNNKLYGGTSPRSRLYEWNGVDAWVDKAPQPITESHIRSMAVFNNKLYGGTQPNGKLYEWNGVDTWVQKAPQLGAEDRIYSLAVFNGKLYGSTRPNGKLYEWNGTDAWVEKAPKLGAEIYIYSLAVFNNKLYGGTSPNGKLYEWNGTNAWLEKAPQLGAEIRILSLAVFNGKLYGGTAENGKLYEVNI